MMEIKRATLLAALELVSPGLTSKEMTEQSDHVIFKDNRMHTMRDFGAFSVRSPLPGFTGAIAGERLIPLLSKVNDDVIVVEKKNGVLKIHGKNKLSGFSVEKKIELPLENLPDPKEENWTPFSEAAGRALMLASKCVSSSESSPILTCIHITPDYIEAGDNSQHVRFMVDVAIDKPLMIRGHLIDTVYKSKMTELNVNQTFFHFRNEQGFMACFPRMNYTYLDMSEFLDVEGEEVMLPKGLDRAIDKASLFSVGSNEHNEVWLMLKDNKAIIEGNSGNEWYKERFSVDYEGRPLSFTIRPDLLTGITLKNQLVTISEGVIKMQLEKNGVYACALGKV